jgi:hypothetical protein
MRSSDARELNNDASLLSAHSLVMAEPAFPHVVCPGPSEQEPAGLDRQPLYKVNTF